MLFNFSTICRQQRLISQRVLTKTTHNTNHTRTINGTRRFLSSSSSSKSTNTTKWALGIVGGGTVLTIGTVAYINNHVGGSEGLQRTTNFYSLAIPKYIEYRYHMIRESPDEVWDKLHEETSKLGLDKIMELQGFYVKR